MYIVILILFRPRCVFSLLQSALSNFKEQKLQIVIYPRKALPKYMSNICVNWL